MNGVKYTSLTATDAVSDQRILVGEFVDVETPAVHYPNGLVKPTEIIKTITTETKTSSALMQFLIEKYLSIVPGLRSKMTGVEALDANYPILLDLPTGCKPLVLGRIKSLQKYPSHFGLDDDYVITWLWHDVNNLELLNLVQSYRTQPPKTRYM